MIGSWFATAYDEPRPVLGLPAEVGSGQDDAVTIVDQVVRGTKIVGRVTGDFGAVALKIEDNELPVHVRTALQLDELGTRWWSDRVRPPRHEPELPRLVLLRAQGRIRGAAVLARRQGWRGAASAPATVDFLLAEGDLDGLLVVEVAEAKLPSWTAGRIAARSALGLRIDTVSVREATAPPATAYSSTGCDLAILQPGAPATFRLETTTVPLAPPVPRSPVGRLTRRRPARAVFKLGRLSRRVAIRAGSEALPVRAGVDKLGVVAADLSTGVQLEVELLAHGAGSIDVRLAAPPETPVLIGLDRHRPGVSCRIVPLR